jgi:hypothetical protein
LLQTARWLPDRRIVAVADSSFSVIELPPSVSPHLDVVTRLRLDAGLAAYCRCSTQREFVYWVS